MAQRMQLLLPSRDSRPIRIEEGPLQHCLAAAEAALNLETCLDQRLVLVLTDASKVTEFVTLLRTTWPKPQPPQQQQRLIGFEADESNEDRMWLLGALDVIVATPEQAVDYRSTGGLTAMTVKGLLVDRDVVDRATAKDIASLFQGFQAFITASRLRHVRPIRWFSPQTSVHVTPAIRQLIPGSPDLWDTYFLANLTSFAWAMDKVAVQELSDVPLFLPGLIRGSLSSRRDSLSPTPLLLAPKDKLEGMIQLLHVCAAQLGLRAALTIGTQPGSHILVQCPEELTVMTTDQLERLVVVEADKLLDSDSARKVMDLLEIAHDRPVGLHFSRRTEAVDGILNDCFHVVKELGVRMTGVCQFVSLVQCEEEKMSRLCQVWSDLKHPSFPLSVFCNSADQVKRVAAEMKKRGCDAWAFCGKDGEEEDPMMYEGRSPVLVTDVYRRTSCHVINYEVPASYDEYVQRVGRERTDRIRKVVINLGTAAELAHLPLASMLELPRGGRDDVHIYKRLRQLFPDTFRAASGISV